LAEPCGFEHERGPVSGASSRVWAGCGQVGCG
jgi:hypothetical protein